MEHSCVFLKEMRCLQGFHKMRRYHTYSSHVLQRSIHLDLYNESTSESSVLLSRWADLQSILKFSKASRPEDPW